VEKLNFERLLRPDVPSTWSVWSIGSIVFLCGQQIAQGARDVHSAATPIERCAVRLFHLFQREASVKRAGRKQKKKTIATSEKGKKVAREVP
jgi:hypothetical protein